VLKGQGHAGATAAGRASTYGVDDYQGCALGQFEHFIHALGAGQRLHADGCELFPQGLDGVAIIE